MGLPIAGALAGVEHLDQRVDIVAVNVAYIPSERLELHAQVLGTAHLGHLAIDLQAVVIDDGREVVELAVRGERMENSFGSQIRNYVLYPYQLVKDLRSGVETSNVDAVLAGDIEQFVIGYHKWRVSQ